MNMMQHESFECPCEPGNVVLRESHQFTPMLSENDFGCSFLWKDIRVRLLAVSPGGSTTQSYSPGPSTTLSYSAARPSTPPTYSSGPSRNADCSNCKLLIGKITALEETLEMYMHPENHTLDSTALLNDLYNDMDKFGLE
ncbi:hypothetical protein Tco_0630808 [Tanacetum coccineum]